MHVITQCGHALLIQSANAPIRGINDNMSRLKGEIDATETLRFDLALNSGTEVRKMYVIRQRRQNCKDCGGSSICHHNRWPSQACSLDC